MISLCMRGSACRTGVLNVVSSLMRKPASSLSVIPKNQTVLKSSFLTQTAAATTAAGVHGPYNQGAEYRHHNYTSHWTIERVIDVGMLPLIPAAFYTDNVALNYVLIVALGAHAHWGLEAIVVDYFRPRVVGNFGAFLAKSVVYLLSMSCFAGLLYLNYTQMPPTKAIKTLWTL